MSAFKIFILHAGHCDSSSFLLLKYAAKQLKQNLCLPFNTFIGFFSIFPQLLQQQRVICGLISVLLTLSNFTTDVISDIIWEGSELKNFCVQVEYLTLFFWSTFSSSLYFKPSFANKLLGLFCKLYIFQLVESSCSMVMCFYYFFFSWL